MLYRMNKDNVSLDKLNFYSLQDLGKLEKDLENIMVQNIKELFLDNTQIMTVFQETAWQEEPDICALDKDGNLILFELKRHNVNASTTMQILRYVEIFGQKTFIVVSQQFHNERAIFIARYYNIEAYGYNAKDLNLNKFSVKTKVRELFARVKVFVDIALGTGPRFLGDPIDIYDNRVSEQKSENDADSISSLATD